LRRLGAKMLVGEKPFSGQEAPSMNEITTVG